MRYNTRGIAIYVIITYFGGSSRVGRVGLGFDFGGFGGLSGFSGMKNPRLGGDFDSEGVSDGQIDKLEYLRFGEILRIVPRGAKVATEISSGLLNLSGR